MIENSQGSALNLRKLDAQEETLEAESASIVGIMTSLKKSAGELAAIKRQARKMQTVGDLHRLVAAIAERNPTLTERTAFLPSKASAEVSVEIAEILSEEQRTVLQSIVELLQRKHQEELDTLEREFHGED